MATKKRTKRTSKRTKQFTVEAGRQVYLNGKPFIGVSREGEARPVDADAITHIIANCLNKSPRAVNAIMKRYGGRGHAHFGTGCTCNSMNSNNQCPLHDPRDTK